MDNWQPIRTAPKDGSRILVYRDGYHESMAVVWGSVTDNDWHPVHGSLFNGATHWMPLPDPPEETR